ncbi:hypothetical protein N9N67_05880 [Bacteriovoracaceae bacterium]|nr:hypothetical protein [Bacteriovoracaceae bacterium]
MKFFILCIFFLVSHLALFSQESKSSIVLKSECDQGQYSSCSQLAQQFEKEDKVQESWYYKLKSCSLCYFCEDCFYSFESYFLKYQDEIKRNNVFERVSLACEKKSMRDCTLLARMSRKKVKKTKYFKKACLLGDHHACHEALELSDGLEIKETAVKLMKQKCHIKEKYIDFHACSHLAQLYTKFEQNAQAAPILEKLCFYQFTTFETSFYCNLAAKIYAKSEKTAVKGIKFDAPNCSSAKFGSPPDGIFSKACKRLENLCYNQKVAQACTKAGYGHYPSYDSVPANKALPLFQLGCDLGDQDGCKYAKEIKLRNNPPIKCPPESLLRDNKVRSVNMYKYQWGCYLKKRVSQHHGPYIIFYQNGDKHTQHNYRFGKLHGRLIKWFENGVIAREENYKEDERIGPIKIFLKDGRSALPKIKTDLKHFCDLVEKHAVSIKIGSLVERLYDLDYFNNFKPHEFIRDLANELDRVENKLVYKVFKGKLSTIGINSFACSGLKML